MPVHTPFLFCVITWMEKYGGVRGDHPSGGGSFIDTQGYGYEIFNFRSFRDNFYGFVEPGGRIGLERLGAERHAESFQGVTVVFVAPFQGEGSYVIVGWYKKATVYRSVQDPPNGSARAYQGSPIGFNLRAARQDGFLILPVDNRVFVVPRGKGGVGQKRIWYADKPEDQNFVRKVRRYVEAHKPEANLPRRVGHHGRGWQQDVERKQIIERIAVQTVWNHFESLGYLLKSLERDNCGWDLEATLATTTLRLEVKGTSGDQVFCEVTPNEYRPIVERMRGYRLCIVCNALETTPQANIFAWSKEQRAWCSQTQRLSIKEVVGARLSVES